MAAKLDPGQDKRGKELAENNTPLDQRGTKPLSSDEESKFNNLTAGLGDKPGGGGNKKTSGGAGGGKPNIGAFDAQHNPDDPQTEAGARNLYANSFSKFNQPLARRAFNLASKHRRSLMGAGGGAGIIALLLFSMVALAPLKLESLIKNFWGHEADRMESYIEHRATVITVRYFYQKVAHQAAPDRIYIGNNILKTLYGNWQKSKFEKRLLEKYGIKVEAAGARGIRFAMANGVDVSADTPEKLVQLLNKDLKGRQAISALNQFLRDDTHYIQFIKRAHIRRYMRNAYRITRWSIKQKEETHDPSRFPQTETGTAAADSTMGAGTAEIGDALNCILPPNTGCEDPAKRRGTDGSTTGRPPISEPNTNNADVQAKTDETSGKTREAVKKAYQDTTDAIKAGKAATKEALTKVLQKAFGKTVTAAIFESVPVIGWISLASELDNFFWHGKLREITVRLHSVQYANVYATYASFSDQMKAGKLTSSQFNIIMYALENIEKSNAFQRVLLGSAASGQMLPDDKRVGSDKLGSIADDSSVCGANWFFLHGTEPIPQFAPGDVDYWTYVYRHATGLPLPAAIHTPLCFVRAPLNAINAVVGGVLGPLVSVAITLAKFVYPNLDKAIAAAGKGMEWLFLHVFTPVATGAEIGADLGNALNAGADVIVNQACRDILGCANIADALAYDQSQQIAADTRAMLKQEGFLASLTNIEVPEALGSQLLAALPATPGKAISQTSSYAFAMLANPFKFFAMFSGNLVPTTNAAAQMTNFNGVQRTGYTVAQVDDAQLHLPTQDIAGPPGADGALTGPDGRFNQYDCPVIEDVTQTNQCLLDVAAAQGLCSGTSTADDGGLGGNGGDPGACGQDAVNGTPGGSTSPSPDTINIPSSDIKALALLVLANKNITFWTNNGVNTRDVFVALSQGKPAYTTCPNAGGVHPDVNPNILKFILEAAGQTHVMVNALTDKCHTNGSNHYSGEAVDLDVTSGPLSILNPIAAKYGGAKNSETSHHHFDFKKK
ncbi:MAG: hypothetical protein JWN01_1065 [Patescibacteria group bacterium]|nr:hypothetical protein [Patescibacteria group bacterium]